MTNSGLITMANEIVSSVVPFQQPKKTPLTAAERQRACRARKAAAQAAAGSLAACPSGLSSPGYPASSKPPAAVTPVTEQRPVTVVTPVTRVTRVTRPKLQLPALDASNALVGAAVASAAVGICMNGWYARSLGSSDVAGWLFLAIGVVADVSALFLPTGCARLAAKRQRGAAAIGWMVWFATFLFAVCAGIGFASTNISDVTSSRASRVTPAVTATQKALDDATAARDRECKGGVGKWCREREAAVVTQRQALDVAMRSVAEAADPQVEAATHIVSWLSRGLFVPTVDDFAMLRLVLLALLPQVGGVLLMVGRGSR
jgi:hypothetical protein